MLTDRGSILHADCACVKPDDIGEFNWADLQGDGRFALVATYDVNGRKFFNALAILRRDSSGKLMSQDIDGWMIHDLPKVVRDLNGDGRDEIIVPTVLVSHNTAETVTWPAVYRFREGKYIEASREFPHFYQAEILPSVDEKIEQTRDRAAKNATSANPRRDQVSRNLQALLADQITLRDKILRLSGSAPTAGLDDARAWMSSHNPIFLQDAAATFEDIGGYQAEARAAGEAYRAQSYQGRGATR